MKHIKKMFNNLLFSTILLYSINILLIKINVIIPINVYSLGMSTVFGLPGLLTYILLFIKYGR